ncbi:MAG: hypothetical protein R2849_15035 [Thermomicrobiales bacterium]
MKTARLAMSNPRAFVVGLALGALLISAGFIMALFATGQVGATHEDDSVVHVCVSRYTGAMRHVEDPANCTAYETPVDLGAGDPAMTLTYTVRTVTTDPSTVFILGTDQVDCRPGETAINGGSRLTSDGGEFFASSFKLSGGGLIGSPPTGWLGSYVVDGQIVGGPGTSNPLIETWVLCVS